jgi:predicted regulator of Ras-like GTPase activity (Roadblock/LC7/MglB family)
MARPPLSPASEVGTVLSRLRDVQGVLGSFVISEAGDVLGRDMPKIFDDAVLREAGARVPRLHEALASGGDSLRAVVLVFADHKLRVHFAGTAYLCLMTDASVNEPALKLAANLVAKKVATVLMGSQELPLSSDVRDSTFPSASQRSPAIGGEPAEGGQRLYRGRPVG